MNGGCSHVEGLSHSQGTAVSQHTMAGETRERQIHFQISHLMFSKLLYSQQLQVPYKRKNPDAGSGTHAQKFYETTS